MPLSPTGGWPQEPSRERGVSDAQAEAFQNLQAEIAELNNILQCKDQRIAELGRANTSTQRLKRDIRQMASELNSTRKQLAKYQAANQELLDRISLYEVVDVSGNASNTISFASKRDRGDREAGSKQGGDQSELIAELQEQNRQLRDALVDSQQKVVENVPYLWQPSGASTQRAAEQAGPGGTTPTTAGAARGIVRATGTSVQAAANMHGHWLKLQDEMVQPIVYTSLNHEHARTTGPTMLEGIGLVKGVREIAQVILSRNNASVLYNKNPQFAAVDYGLHMPSQTQQLHGHAGMAGMSHGM